jgi:hypothetical protein
MDVRGERNIFRLPAYPAVKSIQAVMSMESNISIRFEKGVFQISAEIPVAKAREAIESFVGELSAQLLGEELPASGKSLNIAPRLLNERDAARYIGRSVSFLRTCRNKAKRGETDPGPRYVRHLGKLIFFPVKELDDWLNRNSLFRTRLEEKTCIEGGQVTIPQIPETKSEVIQNA